MQHFFSRANENYYGGAMSNMAQLQDNIKTYEENKPLNEEESQAGLSTANTLFSNIIPAYMGMFVGMASVDAIGVLVAALAMEILNYGLSCIGLGAGGWQQIIVGTFMLVFYALTAQFPRIKAAKAKKARLAA